MRAPGFILIEVLLASALAAIIGVLLLASFDQINKSVMSVDSLIDVHSRATLVGRQMEHDIAGAFIPLEDTKNYVEKEDEKAPSSVPEQKTLDKIFYGSSRDGQLNILTFITNNPLQVYWSDDIGQAKPCIVRVVYRLEHDGIEKDPKKNSYKLMRQESTNLEFGDFSKDATSSIRAYELARDIKKLSISYKARSSDKDSDTQQKVDTAWEGDEGEYEDLPAMVTIALTLWHTGKRRDTTYTFYVPIMGQGFKQEKNGQENETPASGQQQENPSSIMNQLNQLMPGLTNTMQPLTNVPAASKPRELSHNKKSSILHNLYNGVMR